MNDWRKFRRLRPPDRRLLLRALISLPVVAIVLRSLGIRRCQALIARLVPLKEIPASDPQAEVTAAQGVAQLVHIAASRSFFSAHCLDRAMVLWWLLRSRGLSSEIRYGVQTVDNEFKAHAWVEYADQVIGDHRDIRLQFAPFERCTPS